LDFDGDRCTIFAANPDQGEGTAMFENAQQEPSGGSTKIILGVVVVAAIVGVAVYYAVFAGAPPAAAPTPAPAAATSAANTPAPNADYSRDLVILSANLGRDQTQTQAVWAIQVSNRSREITYRNIRYATVYSDGAGNEIRRGAGTLPEELGPGQQRTFSGLNDGEYPLATARYTVEWTGADGFVP
jgi:hypothetical protein